MDRLKQVSQVPPRELVVNAAAITTVLSAVVWGVRDYQAFLALGPGGVAHNVKGWLLVTLLRPFALSKRGALRASDYPTVGAHEEIEALPNRTGPRATVGGIVPHRQLSQHPGEGMKPYITNLFKNVVKENSELLEERLSLYEMYNPALFVREGVLSSQDRRVPEVARIARGEIGHVHPDWGNLQYSIHLYLSPADTRQIIAKGWGEKHRLSKPETSIFDFKKYHIGDTYILIYGPRNEEEIEIVSKILQSSIRYMTGRDEVELPEWKKSLGGN